MPTPLRDGGIYHVATGTWTRPGATANLGSDVIYNASAPSGYFGTGWEGSETVDEGILPSTSSTSFGGPQDRYVIDGFEFAYCSLADTIDWSFSFYDGYVPCDMPSNPAACMARAGSFATTGFPAGGACWLVTIDLAGGNELCMGADGGPCAPGYQGSATDLDHFGWGATFVTGNGGFSGPVLAGGDPDWAPEGEGTCYLPSLTCPTGATAAGARDLFAVDGSGCFNFGGYSNPNGCGAPQAGVFAQLYLRMFTDCAVTCDRVYEPFCNTSSAQVGEVSIDTNVLASNPILTTSGMTQGLFAIHLIGAGTGVVKDPGGVLDGDLCIAGAPIGRYVQDLGSVVSGAHSTDLVNGNTGGGVGALPNPPGGFLAPGQTWNFQTWFRVPGSSRLSTAIRVTFQ